MFPCFLFALIASFFLSAGSFYAVIPLSGFVICLYKAWDFYE